MGLNGETCYVLITDHFNGRIFGRAFATRAPLVDWLNNWLANNAPTCSDKYVRMDRGDEKARNTKNRKLCKQLTWLDGRPADDIHVKCNTNNNLQQFAAPISDPILQGVRAGTLLIPTILHSQCAVVIHGLSDNFT